MDITDHKVVQFFLDELNWNPDNLKRFNQVQKSKPVELMVT